ncbi:Transaldolase [Auxenochlorella protothecoides]|uniref:Transaldolase n=1 Tax=Auxenochlorella protothecoides TaxID=3075 RepID=A0A087SPL0_AUXPR|nr:Transaldolase [Auxenochlorella protothecoides]KFM27664.1 Transaldolase [Auxenochlorella protothecoides]RMZ54309.1 hypothetical protein APUTEX25_001467 [Auxenochlorella protothecoides]|eukprot:RMZ54309.1 hypothetical protein APUTEX25_001467 [Auxenochlorella protothecoides]
MSLAMTSPVTMKLNAQSAPFAQRRQMSASVSRSRTVTMAAASTFQSTKAPATLKAANQLEALKQMSKVVADTGEVDAIRRYKPFDCTTNPSLVYKAMQLPEYEPYLRDAIAAEKESHKGARPYAYIADRLAVNIGAELSKLVPGRVSTEVDAHLSFDTQATVDKALRLIDLYAAKGVDPSKIYIKVASTWEGIRACEVLQKQGISTNMTLIFSFAQAGACADAGASLISPFVGRILDWYKKANGHDYAPHEDPGVESVKRIYSYYKQYGYDTIVMAASFRNIGEIRELAGCDNITISPALLAELEASTDPLPYALWPTQGGSTDPHYDLSGKAEGTFLQMHGEDQMALDKLAEGIKGFAADQDKLEVQIAKAMGA